MAIISQNVVKHVFLGLPGGIGGKTYEVLTTFMQNKANFQEARMNVSIFSQMAYENKSNWTLGENKPNQTQFPKSPNECKLTYNKGLQKKR